MLAQNISKRNNEKKDKPFKVKWIYGCFGISKQAYYKRLKSYKNNAINEQTILKMIQEYRNKVGQRTGGRKLYDEFKDQFKPLHIKIGRDKLFGILRANNLLVPKLKNYHITTDSKHRFHKYKNLVTNSIPTRPEQLWVSDITYIKTDNGHNYLALVTDAYSKQIMGFKLASHMKASLCVEALKMAIKNRQYPNKKLIHHSDRGFQYCSHEYTKYAESNGIMMSMTEQYDPYENAVAERINRTLKYEYGLKQSIKNTDLAQRMIKQAVYIYNNLRKHTSLDFRKPFEVHLNPNVEYKSYKRDKTNLKQLKI